MRWSHLVAPVTAELECSGGVHVVEWCRGRLRVRDHDIAAERALTAMGGEPPLCLDVLDAWPWSGEEVELLDFLASGRSRPGLVTSRAQLIARLTQVQGQLTSRLAGGQHVSAAPIRSRLEKELRLGLLQRLPPKLVDLLAVTLVVGCERRWWYDDAFRQSYGKQFQRVLEARALPLLEAGLSVIGRRLGPRTSLACWVLPPGEQATLTGWAVSGGAGAALSLPLSWLPTVWARGIAFVNGCFVLEAEPVPDRVRVRAVRWERRTGSTLPVTGDAVLSKGEGGWTLSWSGDR
ncbi:MAG TPA: hypothetical protein VNE62_03115 [Actinomycetota bacterium]|nr:hypothetical protein [Actinomycetota bacterium]